MTDSLGHSLQRNNGINGITDESLQRINDHIYDAAKANLDEKQREIEQILGLELIRFYQGNQAWKRASLAYDPAVISGLELRRVRRLLLHSELKYGRKSRFTYSYHLF